MNSCNFLERYLPKNKRVRMMVLMLMDASAIALASFLGLFIRFDLNIERIPVDYARAVWGYLPVYMSATLVIFFLFHMYATMWSVAGYSGRSTYHSSLRAGLFSSDCRNDAFGAQSAQKLFFSFLCFFVWK